MIVWNPKDGPPRLRIPEPPADHAAAEREAEFILRQDDAPMTWVQLARAYRELRVERDADAHLLAEAEIGAREAQTQHEIYVAALRAEVERLTRERDALYERLATNSGWAEDEEREPPMGTTMWTCERCGEPCWSRVAHRHRDCGPTPSPARLPGDAHG